MTIENNNQQKVLKRTTRSPLTSLAAPSLMAAHNESSNSIICVGAQLPPELYDHMQIALIEMMRAIFGAEVTVQFDSQSKKYVGYFEGKQRIEITKDRITCGTGADDEIALAIEAAIQFGWKRIRLNGSDDFKRRAYAEAIRRGYGAGDIDGYTPLTISCTPTATSSLPNSSGAKIPAPSRRSQF